jgi:hypothetical protein
LRPLERLGYALLLVLFAAPPVYLTVSGIRAVYTHVMVRWQGVPVVGRVVRYQERRHQHGVRLGWVLTVDYACVGDGGVWSPVAKDLEMAARHTPERMADIAGGPIGIMCVPGSPNLAEVQGERDQVLWAIAGLAISAVIFYGLVPLMRQVRARW